jgi:hypothetical protein
VIEVREIGKPVKWLIEAAESIGLAFMGLTHDITNEFINHSMKRHGDPKVHGAAAITEADFENISGIVKTPDHAIIGAIRKEDLINAYAKIDNGITYFYFEKVLISRKNNSLRGKTFYKVTRPLTFSEILRNISSNGKTDIAMARILTLIRL